MRKYLVLLLVVLSSAMTACDDNEFSSAEEAINNIVNGEATEQDLRAVAPTDEDIMDIEENMEQMEEVVEMDPREMDMAEDDMEKANMDMYLCKKKKSMFSRGGGAYGRTSSRDSQNKLNELIKADEEQQEEGKVTRDIASSGHYLVCLETFRLFYSEACLPKKSIDQIKSNRAFMLRNYGPCQ